jgi:hypothetical protein
MDMLRVLLTPLLQQQDSHSDRQSPVTPAPSPLAPASPILGDPF